MSWSVLRKEFRLVQFGLNYPDAADFAKSPVSLTLKYFCQLTKYGQGLP